MIIFSLGLLTGLCLATISISFALSNSRKLERKLGSIGKLLKLPDEKVEFFPPVDEQDEALEKEVEENDKRGLDTEIE